MNRQGLWIALACAAVAGGILGAFPGIDLAVAAWFYDPQTGKFPALASSWMPGVRHGAMAVVWAAVIAAAGSLILRLILPRWRQAFPARAAVLFLVAALLVPGVLSNLVFKNNWARPRPIDVTEFRGEEHFVPWWDPRGDCPSNCSFFSGEASAAFWTYAPAALAPPQWRPLAYGAATVFGLVIGLMRMAFGGHFLSDVIAAGVVAFLVVWFAHGYLYRWPRTCRPEEGWVAALSRAGLAIRAALRRLTGAKTNSAREGSPPA